MKHLFLCGVGVLLVLGCDAGQEVPKTSLPAARRGFQTRLVEKETIDEAVEQPPPRLFRVVQYPSAVGELSAYVSVPPNDGTQRPAIIWIFGGFSNSIGSTAWEPGPPSNDQSARAFRERGIVMMYPSFRGGNENPGHIEGLYGEVDDVLSAREYLAKQDFVDPNRIYLGGHSTGGTLALLVAESTDTFRAVFALGPVGDVRGYGREYFNFDTGNRKEWLLRSPAFFLHAITTPTHVFEGTEGNIDSLRRMRDATDNPNVHFHEIAGADHFNAILRITKMAANKILEDRGPQARMRF